MLSCVRLLLSPSVSSSVSWLNGSQSPPARGLYTVRRVYGGSCGSTQRVRRRHGDAMVPKRQQQLVAAPGETELWAAGRGQGLRRWLSGRARPTGGHCPVPVRGVHREGQHNVSDMPGHRTNPVRWVSGDHGNWRLSLVPVRTPDPGPPFDRVVMSYYRKHMIFGPKESNILNM